MATDTRSDWEKAMDQIVLDQFSEDFIEKARVKLREMGADDLMEPLGL